MIRLFWAIPDKAKQGLASLCVSEIRQERKEPLVLKSTAHAPAYNLAWRFAKMDKFEKQNLLKISHILTDVSSHWWLFTTFFIVYFFFQRSVSNPLVCQIKNNKVIQHICDTKINFYVKIYTVRLFQPLILLRLIPHKSSPIWNRAVVLTDSKSSSRVHLDPYQAVAIGISWTGIYVHIYPSHM